MPHPCLILVTVEVLNSSLELRREEAQGGDELRD